MAPKRELTDVEKAERQKGYDEKNRIPRQEKSLTTLLKDRHLQLSKAISLGAPVKLKPSTANMEGTNKRFKVFFEYQEECLTKALDTMTPKERTVLHKELGLVPVYQADVYHLGLKIAMGQNRQMDYDADQTQIRVVAAMHSAFTHLYGMKLQFPRIFWETARDFQHAEGKLIDLAKEPSDDLFQGSDEKHAPKKVKTESFDDLLPIFPEERVSQTDKLQESEAVQESRLEMLNDALKGAKVPKSDVEWAKKHLDEIVNNGAFGTSDKEAIEAWVISHDCEEV